MDKPVIFAYGFEAAGFIVPGEEIETDNYRVRFIGFQAELSLEDARGIIMPSGIFERFKEADSLYGGGAYVACDRERLAKRMKEVIQNYKRGGWIALLLGMVSREPTDTDLARVFLNNFFLDIEGHAPNPHVRCRVDEFADYLHDFGISQTSFGSPRSDCDPRMIAGDGRVMAAAEVQCRLFFLPLLAIEKNRSTLERIVTRCADAILEYRRRNEICLPAWVEKIEFRAEGALREQLNRLEAEIVQTHEGLARWRRYKGMLSASGNALKAIVVEVLSDYFKLEVHSKEEFIEDAIIVQGGKPLFVVEVKGINGGLKRDHVNQVDSHRERLGLSAEIPGLLILNDFSDVNGLEERKAKRFDRMHLSHAAKLNIRILRTTTLLKIVLDLEDENDRGPKLLNLCASGTPLVELPTVGNQPAEAIE